MTSLASLQSQQRLAQTAYDRALATLNSLKGTEAAAKARISSLQAQITGFQISLATVRNAKDRATLHTQIRRAQTDLVTAQNSLRAAQRSIAALAPDVEKKKATLDVINAALLAATAAASAPVAAPVFKRALLVGINYLGTQYELAGCINDVNNMKTQMQTFFPKLTDITILTDDTPVKPSKANVLAAIDALVSGLKAGENILFHFSGHGGYLTDKNGDEVSGYDSCIYPCNDGTLETISDDELRAALATRVPAGCKCLVVLDSCFSGTAVDLRYLWQTGSTAGALSYTEDTHYEKTGGDVLFLSAAKDTQTAADTVDASWRPSGALTWALLDTWRTYGPAIKTKYLLWDVRTFLQTRGYSQIPQLSTGRYIDLQNVFDLNG